MKVRSLRHARDKGVTGKQRERYIALLATLYTLPFSAAMTSSRFARLLAALLSWCPPSAGFLQAQTVADAAPQPPGIATPTVTPEMGDPGGKYFGQAPDPAKTRHYYIAAEPDLWNYAPNGVDPICGNTLPPQLILNRVAWKIRYVQYADANFSARVLPATRLGIMGPVLRGTTGEYLAVTVLNRSWRPISMHPHGVRYDHDSEGSYHQPNPGRGASIAPGAQFTYVWKLDEDSGPLPSEPSSKAWLYHSHVVGDEEISLGLVGFIIVTDPARARPDGTPKDVDREEAALFTIFNESSLTDGDGDEPDERPANAPTGPVQRTWAEIQEEVEQGERHTINGRSFGNLAGLEMNEGERVRWYLFGVGSEQDFHTAHWHGMTVTEEGRRRTDVVELLPASMKVADMHANNPGEWLLHCHVAEHMANGMYAPFIVHPVGKPGASREPAEAFFGMPGALETLKLEHSELTFDSASPSAADLNFSGQVTVPDPYPIAGQLFEVSVAGKVVKFQPDASGLCVAPEGMLVVKNAAAYGNGAVTGGTLKFDVTLKYAAWLRTPASAKPSVAGAEKLLPIQLRVGQAKHVAEMHLETSAR